MLKTKNKLISRLTAILLTLVLTMGVLPTEAWAAQTNPPDWNFLSVFVPLDADYEDNGTTKYVKTSMSRDEVTTLLGQLTEFGRVMEESGVMKPHFRNVETSVPIRNLTGSNSHGPYPTSEDLGNIITALKDYGIDLDAYDHVFVFGRMDGVEIGYGGITPREVFDNGTTYTFLPAGYLLRDWGSTPKRPAYVILHEFLHTMEMKPGCSFDLHSIEADRDVQNYPSDEKYKACMLDIILNRITGEHGSGVVPSAWSYSPAAQRSESQELTIPTGTTEIKDNAYQYMFNLSHVTIPNSVKSIGKSAFRNTALKNVDIPAGVTFIDDFAFRDCASMKEITMSDSVTSMGGSVFDSCSDLEHVTLSKRITSIPTWTFTYCRSLAEILIPSGVASISEGAFYGCANLKRIAIPGSVTSIADWAFNLSGVTDVYYGGTEEQWKAIQIGEYNAALTNATVHYNSVILEVSSISQDRRSVSLFAYPDDLLKECRTVYAASYDDSGKMTGIVQGAVSQETLAVAFTNPVPVSAAGNCRLFFLDGENKPVYACVKIPAA